MKKRRKTNIFDRLFKQLMHLSRKAVIRFINGLFGVNHPLNSSVSYPNTEYVTPDLRRFISDITILIGGCKYQIEAQINNDLNMAIRVFRYGFEESLRSKTEKDGEITLSFPQVRVIYWETTRKTQDVLTLNLKFPDGKIHKYQVKTFKFLDYSIAELEQRKMSILLPFYVLKLRKQVKAAKTGKRRQELAKEMEILIDQLVHAAKRSANTGVLDNDDSADVIKQMNHLLHEIYQDYNEFKEVSEMAQKQELRWSEQIKLKARRQERRKNQQEYYQNQLASARNMKADGLPVDKIITYTGLTPQDIENL
ncbi:hypothetical protein AGMMS50268_16420 [Spirochaetia bacterium]|nr:hypothetical protein AGMMS50268_16420 [Spirochaetia bacterium]